jgi:hypothetical protein
MQNQISDRVAQQTLAAPRTHFLHIGAAQKEKKNSFSFSTELTIAKYSQLECEKRERKNKIKYSRLFHNQSGSDEILGRWRHILKELIREREVVLRNVAERFLLGFASEGRVAREQDVGQHPQ